MKTDRFYKTNGYVGSSVLFWAMNGRGYTTNIDLAHVYTREKAQRDVDNGWLRNEDEFPLSADDVDSLSEWRVDFQYVKKTYPEFTDPNDEYVAYRKGHFDGNDLGFAAILSHDYDYSSARVFTEKEVAAINTEGWVVIPKYHTDELARRTFQKKNINHRKMITGAGITGVRKKKRSQATGKTRFNCIICGKIVWEYAHPDDFEIMTCSNACETDRE